MSQDIQKEIGIVKVSDEVVGTIAGLATVEVPGVAGMSGGIVDGFAKLLTGTQLTKGVKVEVGEKEAAIDLSIIVDYGVSIPEVAWKVQENVKRNVEQMTGLNVVEVNVYIQGVHMGKKEGKEENRRFEVK
ncbi:MAG: Asp23/Gls24 family envelope stress response protein [bacterium]|nr:Asp23/Gls24 family envelope stress response protein [bacterium]